MIGKEILNYRITSLIGSGGMGSVFLAEHTLIKNERVAIKVIKASMANSFTRELLQKEAEHLAALNHNNIVSFKNYQVDEEGNIYLIMEYASGVNLEDYIKNVSGLIVEERICSIFEPILDAVGYAHKRKRLHRDIKPANIVITEDGGPKILDFGIAEIIKNNGEEEKRTVIMGTPSYMSPEQIRGEHLDERSDIYSLGVLLHYMLTGNPPYDTTTLTEYEINMKVVEEELPRMKTYYKYISERIQGVVDKATAKNPSERYSSCEEFKKALHRAVYPSKMGVWAKIAIVVPIVLLMVAGVGLWDYMRVRVEYYKDYAECWGVPVGIGELSSSEQSAISRSYKFYYQKGDLIRVSHVNGVGSIIDDGESERYERPVDQHFFYDKDGNVSRVIVKDRAGKVQYVKSYRTKNGKINLVVFQYDDEFGTERTISNQTIGYNHAFDEDDSDNGRISRWSLEFDSNGFIKSERFRSFDNSDVSDANGIYGRVYKRDEKGRPVEIQYVGIDGEPKATAWGLGVKQFEYDEEDNWIRATYLTIDGEPAYDAKDGVSVYELDIDENGNCIYAVHKDGDGNVMYPKMNGIAGIRMTYNENGLLKKKELVDADMALMFSTINGFAYVEYEYDENGYVTKQSFFDVDGNPIKSARVCAVQTCVNDANGNILEYWTYDEDGELMISAAGHAGVINELDSVGNVVKCVYYDNNRIPCADSDGSYGLMLAYDDKNHVTEVINLGSDLQPAVNNNNSCVIKIEYNSVGKRTRISYYDTDGETLMNGNGLYAVNEMVYDENGNLTEDIYYNSEEKPVIISKGYHKVKYTYDNYEIATERYYGVDGTLVSIDGVAGYNYKYDDKGNIIENVPVGVDEKLAYGYVVFKYEYYDNDNLRTLACYQYGQPVLNTYGIHKYEYTYNSRNEKIEERFYNSNGKLTISSQIGAAICRYEYNDKGECIATSYFGVDEKPCRSAEGWSSATYAYDVFGNIVKQCFFGTDGNPMPVSEFPPVGIAEYDKWGNMIYVAGQDSKGNFVNAAGESWSIMRKEYDKNNRVISISYFNTKDKPTLCSDGYHKITYKHDEFGNTVEEAYFGKDFLPMLVNDVHVIRYSYVPNTSKVVEMACYGTSNKPVDCAAGWHKIAYTYNEDYSLQTIKHYYRANGTLYTTVKWENGAWVEVKKQDGWHATARSLQAKLPKSLGAEMLNFTITSIKITGETTCTVSYKIDMTKKEMDSDTDTFNSIKETVRKLTMSFDQDFKNTPTVTGNLYDVNGKLVYSVKY